jgi:hypothetical protein
MVVVNGNFLKVWTLEPHRKSEIFSVRASADVSILTQQNPANDRPIHVDALGIGPVAVLANGNLNI